MNQFEMKQRADGRHRRETGLLLVCPVNQVQKYL